MAKRWINSADVVIDDATGALLVKLLGDISADVIDADMFAVTGGNGGDPGTGGKTLKDVDTTLASILSALWILTFSPIAKVPAVIAKTFTTPGTGVPLFAAETFCKRFWVQARRSETAVNAGNVWIEDAGGNVLQTLLPGDYWEMPIPDGVKIDLASLKVDGATGSDGVIGGYVPA